MAFEVGYHHELDANTNAYVYCKNAKWKTLIDNGSSLLLLQTALYQSVSYELANAYKHNPQAVRQKGIRNKEGILVLDKYQAGDLSQ